MAFNFKNEEDVKEYINNIYMEYRFGCESEKNGNACHLLGDYAEAIKKDPEQAANLYKENCDERNWPRSCAKFGGYKFEGKGCEKNIDEAFKYLQKSCELKDARGCLHAGIMCTVKNIVLQEDPVAQIKLGMDMLQTACHEFNQEKACFHLAGIYMGARKEHIEPDLREAYKLNLKCCEMGNAFACANISQMHARGEGAQKNQELANSFKERAMILHRELSKLQKQLQFQQGIDP